MHSSVTLLLALYLAGASAVAPAPPAERVGPFAFEKVPFREAVMRLVFGSGSSEQYTISPEVPNTPVSVRIPAGTPLEAAQALVKAAVPQIPGLTVYRQVATVEILAFDVLRPRAADDPAVLGGRRPERAGRVVQVDFRQTPLRDALAFLSRAAGLRITAAPDVPNMAIDLTADDLTAEAVFRIIVRQLRQSGYHAQPLQSAAGYRIVIVQPPVPRPGPPQACSPATLGRAGLAA